MQKGLIANANREVLIIGRMAMFMERYPCVTGAAVSSASRRIGPDDLFQKMLRRREV